ncbi:transcriptional regulator, HxlR family [Arthrobacter cupressi]|uniref:Transcriptional regulator, HxlR family n=1 Tax=Arthrobacter cupressi TaxID=1045773 RepID=A0A1G8Q421_9MICC|nr:helix-turn-helix domain-containing protein [Arthrobacter cupressi]NYD78013.1 DNA-binding HxlR family transcriptional regulator [Arthrobacter cupressi]SDI99195.1 transcriptional regulator, HxlR family [Arthrobacter cupressi]
MDTIERDTSGLPADVLNPNCPSRVIFQRIGDKWASLVVQVLAEGPVRFSDLRKMVSVVTPKVLTQTLRSLERDGLVTRTVHAQVPPRVDYELTALGRSLLDPLALLRAWAESHVPAILAARDAYDDAQDEALLG